MEARSNKLQAKDLINVGIFTAIYFVIFFAGMMLGYIPIFIPLLGLVCPILCGIPFMLYLTKVKKFGMVSLTGIILGLLNLIMGSGVLVLIFGIIFGVLGDVILRAGKYQSWKCTLLGNGVFSLWIMGYVSRMFLTRDTFFASLVSSYGQEYVDALMSYTPGWMYPVLFVVTFIGGRLGARLGKAVLKKHFEKADCLMDAAVTTLKFEKQICYSHRSEDKTIFDCNCQHHYDYRRHGRIYEPGSPVPHGVPIVFLLLSRKWVDAARFAVTYAILFALELTVLPLLTGTWNFILGAAVGIYTHMLPGFIMGYYLVSTTTVSEFVAAMEKMHIPQKIVIPMSVVFRFFPTVKEEYAAIRDAMKMRGITTLRSPMKMLEYRVVPLMMSIAKIGEELSAAALTRGLGAPQKRTNICKIGFGPLDIFFFLLAIPCWVGFFIC